MIRAQNLSREKREREDDTQSFMALSERKRCFIPYANLISLLSFFLLDKALCIRISGRISEPDVDSPDRSLNSAVFALGSFWRSEASFGCINGVVRTTAGYSGGTKANPEYRNLGDHAESVQVGLPSPRSLRLVSELVSHIDLRRWDNPFAEYVIEIALIKHLIHVEYDPRIISYGQLLDVFWSSHDSRQVFGQGPDVGSQYRSLIFTNSTEELRLASTSKEREQLKSKGSIVTTQIQQLGAFYRAEADHQKFELKQHPFLLQIIGNLPEEELERSALATKLNGYAGELCPLRIQKQIDSRINEIIRKGWPVLKDI